MFSLRYLNVHYMWIKLADYDVPVSTAWTDFKVQKQPPEVFYKRRCS